MNVILFLALFFAWSVLNFHVIYLYSLKAITQIFERMLKCMLFTAQKWLFQQLVEIISIVELVQNVSVGAVRGTALISYHMPKLKLQESEKKAKATEFLGCNQDNNKKNLAFSLSF